MSPSSGDVLSSVGAVKVTDLSFRYGRRREPVLTGLTWTVPSGRTVLLGPNGAGKSTLLALAAGVLQPESGWCEVDGLRLGTRRLRSDYARRIGWMPQTIRPVQGLKVHEQVSYAGWLKGLDRGAAVSAAKDALDLVGLTKVAARPSHELSGGQVRRMGLASALVHQPKLLLLDEPTAGLDPAQRERFRTVLGRLPAATDVVVSTHQVDDLEDSYDTVAVLLSGDLAFVGDVGEFMAHAPTSSRRPADEAYTNVARLAGGRHP